jgi:hypothetical protein
MDNRMDNLTKAKILSGIFAKLVIPFLLGFFAYEYTSAIKEKDRQLRFVELAIEILSQKSDPADSPLRKWAVMTLNAYSIIPFDTVVQTGLVTNDIKLPVPGTTTASSPEPPLRPFLNDSLLALVCEAENLVNSSSPSLNAPLQACLKFRSVIKAAPGRIFSAKDKELIAQADRHFDDKNFDYAALTYKHVFIEYSDDCRN